MFSFLVAGFQLPLISVRDAAKGLRDSPAACAAKKTLEV